jgi:hypothetical protein
MKITKQLLKEMVMQAMQDAPPPDKFGEPDYEGGMARNELLNAAEQAAHLVQMMKESDQLPAWCQSKITLASDYIKTVHDYLMAEEKLK